MSKKTMKLILISVLTFLLLIGLGGASENSNPDAKAEDISIVPKGKPTGDSVDLLFLTIISGYGLQPKDQYTFMGQPVDLSVKINMNAFDLAGSIVYPFYDRQWYSSTNPTSSDNWQKVSGGTNRKLTVNPTSVGTVYYQDSYIKKGLLLGKSFYSDVASVTTYPDPVEATGVTVTVAQDYLYNNQKDPAVTVAYAKPEPFNSTAKLSWSVDNTELAAIDPDTGEITANNSGKSGTVQAIATLTNSNGDQVTGSAPVKIGGGLDDQTVNEGQKATFKVQGNWTTVNSVTWHRVIDGKDSEVSGADGLSHTTPETTYDNNDDKYYAVLKVPTQDASGNDTVTTVTTNKANLTVIADTNPKITGTSNIYNNTYNDHNTEDTMINGVIAGDNLTVRGSFTDTNKNSIMKSGAIQVNLPDNLKTNPDPNESDLTGVKVDGQPTNDYYIGAGPAGDYQFVYLFNIDFSKYKTHTYEFSFDVEDNGNSKFVTTPTLYGQKEDESDIDGNFPANDLTINFSDNQLTAQANDIDYGKLKFSNVGKPVTGTINGDETSDILNVSDNRRLKKQSKILLEQPNGFTSDTGNKLDAELRYYTPDGNYQIIGNSEVVLSDTPEGSTVNSIENNSTTGLKLFIHESLIKNEDYSSTLNWTIQSAP
ncbi:hypothetical protein [Companilactobacillus furfuricola]|uniref:hypothetical protein n=1 Tax=Companilactobacillus furfuricola TaxID=1462575 RepID=UPI000F787BF4|nr:hypothetical protein [Companilactobacillus furfuricola]